MLLPICNNLKVLYSAFCNKVLSLYYIPSMSRKCIPFQKDKFYCPSKRYIKSEKIACSQNIFGLHLRLLELKIKYNIYSNTSFIHGKYLHTRFLDFFLTSIRLPLELSLSPSLSLPLVCHWSSQFLSFSLALIGLTLEPFRVAVWKRELLQTFTRPIMTNSLNSVLVDAQSQEE